LLFVTDIEDVIL